jgi:hypothetical protein
MTATKNLASGLRLYEGGFDQGRTDPKTRGHMDKVNIVNLGEFKESKELKKTEESYGSYLKSLGNSQLEIEVNHLLEEFSKDIHGKDFSTKVRLSLKEISNRACEPMKTKIQILNDETLRLI